MCGELFNSTIKEPFVQCKDSMNVEVSINAKMSVVLILYKGFTLQKIVQTGQYPFKRY